VARGGGGVRGQLLTLNFSMWKNILRKSIGRKKIPSNSENLAGLSRVKLYLSAF